MKIPVSLFWFIVSLGMTLISGNIVRTYNHRLTEANLGVTGVHSITDAADPERILTFWSSHGLLLVARQCVVWDVLFIFCYAFFLGALLWIVLSLWDRYQLHLLLALLGLLPFPTERYVLPKRWMKGLMSGRKIVSVILGVFILVVACIEDYQIYVLLQDVSVSTNNRFPIISYMKWIAIGGILFFSLLTVIYQSAIRYLS